MTIVLTIPGRPVPKGRPRMGVRTRGRRMAPVVYTPQRTKDYEAKIRFCALAAGVRPLTGPLRAEVRLRIHGRRGDVDNYLKAILDGLNGVAYQDDSQIADLRVTVERAAADKQYAEVLIEKAVSA